MIDNIFSVIMNEDNYDTNILFQTTEKWWSDKSQIIQN